jgi:hypothetical protein
MKKYRIQHENRNKRSQEGKQTFSNHKFKVYLVTARFQKDFNFIAVPARNNQLMDRIFFIIYLFIYIILMDVYYKMGDNITVYLNILF